MPGAVLEDYLVDKPIDMQCSCATSKVVTAQQASLYMAPLFEAPPPFQQSAAKNVVKLCKMSSGCMCCRFIYSVERLTAFHSALIDSLRAALLNALPQVGAMLQALLLEVLQRRAAKMPDLMTDMKLVLPGLLASHNHALQNNALQLLKVLLPSETDETAGKVERCMQSSM